MERSGIIHKARNICFQLFLILDHRLGNEILVQAIINLFIGDVFRRTGWPMENSHLTLLLLSPLRDLLAVMRPQIIQNKSTFSPRWQSLDRSHERDEPLPNETCPDF